MLNGLKTKSRYLIFIALTLAPLLTYADSLRNGLTWDAAPLIVDNPVYKDPANLPLLFKSSDTSFMGEQTPYYRPLNNLTFMLDYRLFGLNPIGYHAENVIFHLTAVLLLYALISSLFSNSAVAFLSSMIFAVHPINAEAVNLIVARNNVLAAVFMFLSFIIYNNALRRRKPGYFFLSGFIFFLSALCKESAMMLPLVLLLHDYRFSEPLRKQIKPIITRLYPFVIFTAVYFAMRTYALSVPSGTGSGLEGLGRRMLLNLYIIPEYVLHILFPADLSILYAIPENYLSNKIWLLSIWSLIILLLFLLLRLRNAAVNFGLLWFAVNFIPVSNIFPISGALMADRFMYLPAVGLYITAAECFYYLYTRRTWGKAFILLAAAIIIAFSFLAVKRNLDWRDDLSLFKSMVRSQPDHPEGHYNLGSAYLDAGDLLNAEREWKKTIGLNPKHEGALINLGNLYNLSNSPVKAKEYYLRVLASNPSNSLVHYNLALTLENLGGNKEALRHYEIFLKTFTPEFSYLAPKARGRMEALKE